MARIIQQREYVEETYYQHIFSYPDRSGAGYYVDAIDANGNVRQADADALGKFLLQAANGELIYNGVRELHRSWWEDAVLRCDCGRDVVLSGFTNTCACHADYNSAGQRLAPRSQWGEETGEHLSDILNIR